uniref:ribosomal protein S2 n=1 Tax=Hyalomonas oviformis TaxID=40531 RepID=UPI00226D21D7|nr:ribosomal protein S2 [Hyalomonas oviformis]UZA61987.1 ribosomal protein S2 [Hyalomonas oviformis]
MVKNGMHFGEKAVKFNAKMKHYVWLKKQGYHINRPLIKKGRHFINLFKTRRCLNKALLQLSKYALKGRTFLFIGTKKPAAGLISRVSLFSKTSFFVNTRWLGGMLTNWKTICKSISKIRPILKEKQKIIKDVLEKRQSIKLRLIKKALLLKKKRKLITIKGRLLVNQFKNETMTKILLEKTFKLALKRNLLTQRSCALLQKRQILLQKRKDLIRESQQAKLKFTKKVIIYKNILNLLTQNNKKLRELKYLLLLSQEIQFIKNRVNNLVTLDKKDYEKVKELINKITSFLPQEIMSLIVLIIKNNQENGLDTSLNNKVLIFNQLINNFSRFEPYIKSLIRNIQKKNNNLILSCQLHYSFLTQIKQTLNNYLTLKDNLVKALNLIKIKLTTESHIIRLVIKKLKQFLAQKKLIKYLPRLRFLPTSQTKINQIVNLLMKKMVDPKLKYPIEHIYDDKLSTPSKKLAAARKKKWQRLEKYFGGISNMTKLNQSQIYKNVAIVIGQKEEMNAVRECQKLGIKLFNIVDTSCNPTLADHIIPANDESRNSIKFILNKLLVHIRLAQKLRLNLIKQRNHTF